MDKSFFVSLSNYKPLEMDAVRKAIPSKESVTKYIKSRNLRALDERANAFYADLKSSKVVADANSKLAEKIAPVMYK